MKKEQTFKWGMPYLVMPRHLSKLQGIWSKLGIYADQIGWQDGEIEFILSGSKASMTTFLKGAGEGDADIKDFLLRV